MLAESSTVTALTWLYNNAILSLYGDNYKFVAVILLREEATKYNSFLCVKILSFGEKTL